MRQLVNTQRKYLVFQQGLIGRVIILKVVHYVACWAPFQLKTRIATEEVDEYLKKVMHEMTVLGLAI